MIHGYVHDQNLVGIPDVTVALHDEEGDQIDVMGQATTDRLGYFTLEAANVQDYVGRSVYI